MAQMQRSDIVAQHTGKGANNSSIVLPISTNTFDAAKIPRKFQLPQLNLQMNNTARFDIHIASSA